MFVSTGLLSISEVFGLGLCGREREFMLLILALLLL